MPKEAIQLTPQASAMAEEQGVEPNEMELGEQLENPYSGENYTQF
ncbi:hypothetical protein MNBD_BACTEROID03-1017 [hydrothermal vent metagenome]|uniref:Uncharacterized protein n=1 Tax=hydrothermal vent metagenome TaxID=652676 RepID=A0A3B0TZ71_9ZZZZ